MKGLITVIAVLVVVGLAYFIYRSPTTPPEMTEAERAQMEADVRVEIAERFDGYRAALLTGDAGAFMSMYTSDARVFWPGMNLDKNELQAAMMREGDDGPTPFRGCSSGGAQTSSKKFRLTLTQFPSSVASRMSSSSPR